MMLFSKMLNASLFLKGWGVSGGWGGVAADQASYINGFNCNSAITRLISLINSCFAKLAYCKLSIEWCRTETAVQTLDTEVLFWVLSQSSFQTPSTPFY